MDAEVYYLADRMLLRSLLRTQPTWSLQDLAAATQRSRGWVKKWRKRLRNDCVSSQHRRDDDDVPKPVYPLDDPWLGSQEGAHKLRPAGTVYGFLTS